jgi:CHAT domain-containing protein
LGALPGKREGSYLIEEHAIGLVPVPQLLPRLLAEKRGKAAPSLLAVGGVGFDGAAGKERGTPGWKFQPLPWTLAETKGVHGLFRSSFPKAAEKLLTGDGATRQQVIQNCKGRTHLLFATHGFSAGDNSARRTTDAMWDRLLQYGRPAATRSRRTTNERSGLVFAGANKAKAIGQGEAFLTDLEVAGLDLRSVELAVLSACETGRGRLNTTEGVLGLQRAFHVAGTRTTVASLWNVDDRATWTLMLEFHRNLWVRKLPRLEALRQAQLAMLRGKLTPSSSNAGDERGVGGERRLSTIDRRHPYYWAAFVLSGDWR